MIGIRLANQASEILGCARRSSCNAILACELVLFHPIGSGRRRPVLPSQTAALIERDRSAKLGLSVNNMAPQRSHTSLQIGACNSCGACCSYSSDWPRFTMEEEDDLSRIPRDLVDDSLNGMRCHGDRCAALVGEVGVKTGCVIYGQRPDVCRACEPGDAACQIARDRFGLPRMSRGFHVPFRTWARGR